MKDLFIKQEQFVPIEKTAEMGESYLSANTTNWVKEIITIFLQKFPYMQQETFGVTWTKKDDDKGYAVGSLNVLELSIPVIVNGFRMSPMDVMMLPGMTLPLNDYFLKQYYEKPEAFKGLENNQKKTSDNLFGAQNALHFSPNNEYYGNNVKSTVRDAVKVASVIDSITFVLPEDAKSILKEAASHPLIVKNFKAAENTDILEKIAKKALSQTKVASMTEFINGLEVDRQFAYKDKSGKTFVKQANSTVMKTWDTPIDSGDATDELELKTNEKTASFEKISAFETNISDKEFKIGEVGSIINNNEILINDFEVTNITKVAELEKVAFFKVGDKTLALGLDNSWTITKEAGVNTIDFEEIAGHSPKIGDYGVFITKTAATRPFEVTGISKIAGKATAEFEVDGVDGLYPVHYSLIKHKTEQFEPKDDSKLAFWVPSNAKFVKLAGQNDKLAELKKFEAQIKVEGLNGFNKVAMFISTTEPTKRISDSVLVINAKEASFVSLNTQLIEKTAALQEKHTVIRDGAGLYAVVGTEFNKYAAEAPTRNLSLVEAQWVAIHCGATKHDVEKIAELRPNHAHNLEGDIKAPMTLAELDEKFKKQAAAATIDNSRLFTRSLVKEAANLRDKVTVDAVLSLGMLRPRNLAEYVAVLPTFEYALTEVAKLLIAARLGMAGMDVDSIKNCMDGLSEVVIQLQNADAANKAVR